MKAVKITLAGRTQYLAYTGEAMFQLQEKDLMKLSPQ